MKIKSCAVAVAVAAGVLTAVPVTAGAAATTPPVKNGNLVFVDNYPDFVATQAPGPANPPTFLTAGTNPEYSPDGRQLAFMRTACTDCNSPDYKSWLDVHVRVLSTGSERRVARFFEGDQNTQGDFTAWRTDVTWSPDGKQLVVNGDHILVKLVLASGKQTVIYRNAATQPSVDGPVWSPDGSRIAFSLYPKTIKLIDPDGKNMRTFTDAGEFNLYPDWSPDSRTIAFVTNRFRGEFNTEVVTLPRSGKGTPVRVSYSTRPAGRLQNGVAWSPDGRKIAVLELFNPTDPDEERAQVRAYLPDGSHSYSLTGPVGGDDRPEGLDWAPKLTG